MLITLISGTSHARARDGLEACLNDMMNLARGATPQIIFKPRAGLLPDENHYVLENPSRMSALDQGPYGCCWASAILALYEHRPFLMGLAPITLSIDHLIISQLLEQGRRAIVVMPGEEHTDFAPVGDGYTLNMAPALIEKYGFMPEQAWKPKVSFRINAQVSHRMLLHLNTFIVLLRAGLGDDPTPKETQAAFEKYKEFLYEMVGHPPEHFEVEGESFTALSFKNSKYFKMQNGEDSAELSTYVIKDRSEESMLSVFEKIKRQLLDSHQPVGVTIRWSDLFIDHATGIISFKAFSNFPPTYLALLDEKMQKGGIHSLDIVDFAVDKTGRPTRLLLLNSHGSDMGDRGYYHVYWDYFEEMAKSITLHSGQNSAKLEP